MRIGHEEKYFPELFLKMVENCRRRKEERKIEAPLCPYIKSFGQCMNVNPTSCLYRHKPNKDADLVGNLDTGFKIPSEGFVRFKISFVLDTNIMFVNILSCQSLNREEEIVFDKFKNLDLEMQLYFSDPESVRYVSKFREDEMYAYKDTTTSIFKRIKIIDIVKKDGKIAFELVVKCIDYGSKFSISTQDLVKLPAKFKDLPAQVI